MGVAERAPAARPRFGGIMIFADAAWGWLGVAERTALIRPRPGREPIVADPARGKMGVAEKLQSSDRPWNRG